jgi:hypothetical protein
VARLLDSLRRAGAHEQAAALLARDPAAHAALDHPSAVARLRDSLREAGAPEQAAALAARLPAAGMFGLFLRMNRWRKGLADQFRFGQEAHGTPAAPWGWEDLDLWLVPRYRPRRRNRRDDLNNRRSNRSDQLFEAQLVGGFGRGDQTKQDIYRCVIAVWMPRPTKSPVSCRKLSRVRERRGRYGLTGQCGAGCFQLGQQR